MKFSPGDGVKISPCTPDANIIRILVEYIYEILTHPPRIRGEQNWVTD